MKRFALFCYDRQYPYGGWNDFKGSFDTLNEAKFAYQASNWETYHIVDLTTGERHYPD